MLAECASCARRKAQSLNDFPSLSLLLPEISPNCLHKQPHADCWGSQQGGSEWSRDVETGRDGGMDPRCHPPQKINKSCHYMMSNPGTVDIVQVFRVYGFHFTGRK